MSSVNSTPAEFSDSSSERRDWAALVLESPLLWGTVLTVGFYALIPYLPVQRELAVRYFCAHPLEYATAALFFLGMAILGIKALKLPTERSAFAYNLFRDPRFSTESDAHRKLMLLREGFSTLPPRIQQSQLGERYRDVGQYLAARSSSGSLDEHLKYLAELAAERLQDSYALVRTITWAVPILGFLGTVIGITMAIANVTPDQLDTSLSEVTAGLAVAFDTTALSLTLSMLLVFGSFIVERAEQKILSRVEAVGIRDIAPAFPASMQPQSPLEAAEVKAAEQLLQRTESLIGWQVELWQSSLEELRSRWQSTLEQQQSELAGAIRGGVKTTLEDHSQQLGLVRSEFLEGQRALAQETGRLVSELQQTAVAQQEALARQAATFWDQVGSEISRLRDEQRSQTEQILESIGEQIRQWQTSLEQATHSTTAQLAELRRQGELLSAILDSEQDLTRLQERLAQNLDVVRTAGTFEETLHSLTAAVHLLTVRNRAA